MWFITKYIHIIIYAYIYYVKSLWYIFFETKCLLKITISFYLKLNSMLNLFSYIKSIHTSADNIDNINIILYLGYIMEYIYFLRKNFGMYK